MIFFNEKKLRKIQIIFDIENALWKSEIGIFCQLWSFQAGGTKLKAICLTINRLKGNYWILRIGLMGRCQKVPKFDFQSQFSTSKIIRIFLKFFFIEEYQFWGIFVVIDIYWKLQFLNHFVTKIMSIFLSPPAKCTLICQKNVFMKKCYFPLN